MEGKTSLVTGAAGLLGAEHSRALLECGSSVVLTDVSEDSLDSTSKLLSQYTDIDRIFSYVMDVSNLESVKTVSDDLSAKGKRVDVLVNNAAIDPKVKGDQGFLETSRLENFPLDQWDLLMHQIILALNPAIIDLLTPFCA